MEKIAGLLRLKAHEMGFIMSDDEARELLLYVRQQWRSPERARGELVFPGDTVQMKVADVRVVG